MMSTIVVRGVDKRFGSTVAVDGVDLEVGPGVTGLLGPNGAGKTTLMRMLATVAAPDHGEVTVFGHDPATTAGRLAIRRRLGYQPQEPGFHGHFSCFQFVDYVAILKEWTSRRERHDEVRRVLGLVGLGDVSNRRISRLSGGMKRRLAIAQVLIGSPDLLILDEPTAGLDPEQRLRFRELLGSAAPGATVLLSTHQTDDVSALCSRVIVLLDGQVRFDGSPAELAARAEGRVWLADARDPMARLGWVGGDGRWRNIGDPPAGTDTVAPTIEDGYLVLTGADTLTEAAADE
ncbi:MAG: ATP-binding cassette domain-containing protein [Acidimicrobiia bacterium]|nr:ATP-binding cassette domain-containing protein [Acidimicrobiia bacterium]